MVYYGIPESTHIDNRTCAKASNHADASFPSDFSAGWSKKKASRLSSNAMHLLHAEKDRVSLTIIGDGPQRSQLEAMAREQNDFQPSISFTGSLQGEKLNAALANIDVLVMPSINEEPAGLVVMEQMIRGCPVIVSDHGGGPELAGDAGLKFPPGNAPALAACLRQLADDPALLRELGVRAKNRATALFSLDRMIEEHFNLREIIRQKLARQKIRARNNAESFNERHREAHQAH